MKQPAFSESGLAGVVGVSTRTIRSLAQQGIIPAAVGGKYESNATLKALFRYFRDRKEQRSSLVAATTRDRNASADLKELERREREKELVTMDEAKDVIRQYLGPMREILVTAPMALAARVNPADPELARMQLETWSEDNLKKLHDI
jgi:phage terminase Nu1 subunit (DNA packaging protein)